jgi:iron complex outermembrane receptor protein
VCHSRFRGAFLGAATLAFAPHEIGCAAAQEPLPPVVIQPPRARAAPPRAEAPSRPMAVARPRTSRISARAASVRAGRLVSAPPSAPAAAQAARPAERGYTAAPAGLNLGTPNGTGSRLGLTPFQTPASIEIIPGQKIQERGQNTVQEAITQNATGITNLGAPGNGFQSYTSRGFAGVGSIMTLYDGTRLYVGSGTVTFPFDTWNIDRIEVLRGPASVLYGEGSIGGVVNIVPKKPTFVTLNEVRVAYGSDGAKRLALDSGGAVSQDVAYRLNISGNQVDGWLRPNGDFRNLSISGALLWQVNPDFALTLSHDYGYNEPLAYFGAPTINGRVPRDFRNSNFNVDNGLVTFSDNVTQLKAEWNVSPDITLRNTTYYLSSNRHWRNAESYSFNGGTGLLSRFDYIQIYHNQDQIGNRFDATYRSQILGMKNTFLAGVEANHIDFKHTNNSPYDGAFSVVNPYFFFPGSFLHVDPTRPGFRTSTDQTAFFAENRLQVTDQLALIGGVRWEAPQIKRDDLSRPANSFKTDFEALTYRFGAVYNPVPETALFLQYATGVDPIGNLITTSAAQKDFRLTTGRQIEGGIKQRLWGDFAEFTLTGYHIEKDNVLSRDPLNPTAQIQVGKQSAAGFEAFASVKLHETLRLEGNLALLHAQYDRFDEPLEYCRRPNVTVADCPSGDIALTTISRRGKRPIDIPNQVANLWLSWAFWPRWEARVGLQYVGPVFNDFANSSKRPAYTLVNAGLDYRVTDNSRLSLRGYNLTDEVYAISGSSEMWLLGRPRSVELAYSVAF